MASESLPALITRAGQRLLEARSSGELLEAKHIAEAALHYARVTGAANDTHADCLRIITRAEIRMANEYDAAQERGEVATVGKRSQAERLVEAPPSASDLGLSRKDIYTARQIRDAGEPVVERTIQQALNEGRAPTKSEILAAAREIRAEQQGDKAERRAAKESDLANRIVALPDRRYGVILADPEWRFEPYSRETGMDRAADNHYSTSATGVIAARDVPGIAAKDCVLFLWATVPMLPDALQVMQAWGFTYKSHCCWVKDRIGTGYWFRNKHELLLVGTRGDLPAPAPGTQWASTFDAPVGRHSEKPSNAYELIESYFPNLPKIELNARSKRAGWDVWGAEAPAEEAA